MPSLSEILPGATSVPQKERLDMSIGLESKISSTVPGDAPLPLMQSALSYVPDYTIHRACVLDKESRPRVITKVRPITFSYPGGKARLATKLCARFQQSGSRFVDVFGGRGNLAWRAMQLLNYDQWWVNDIRTADFFKTLLTHGHLITVPSRSREEYVKQKADYITKRTPESVLLQPYLTYSGGGYIWSGFRAGQWVEGGTQAGYINKKGKDTAGIGQSGYQAMLLRAHEMLLSKTVRITKLDYKDVLAELGEDDFAYLDPPYQNSNVRAYESADVDHAELIDILLSAKFRWAMSEYRNPIYLEAFGEPGWSQERTITYGKGTHRPKRVATECLWTKEQRLLGIELTAEYIPVEEARINYHLKQNCNWEAKMKNRKETANADSKTRADSAPVQTVYENLNPDATRSAFKELDKVLNGLAKQVIHTIDQITPHLAEMQSLLSQRGKARKTVLKKAGLPSWTEYARGFASKLDVSVRTIQVHITKLRNPGRKSEPKSKPITPLDRRQQADLYKKSLAADAVVAAVKNGGDLSKAVAKYEKVTVAPVEEPKLFVIPNKFDCAGCRDMHQGIADLAQSNPHWTDEHLAEESGTSLTIARQARVRFLVWRAA
jgi:site-specific DNA-adenine methylase